MFNFLFPNQNFETAIQVVLAHEGLLSDNPNDPGGITDYGISLRFLRAAGIDSNMNRSDHITAADIRALTPEKAKAIYYRYFWKKYNINKIDSLAVSTSLLDVSVLMGGEEAIDLLQVSLNQLIESKIEEDGILGPHTLYLANTINGASSSRLNNVFKEQCKLHLLNLVKRNDKLKVFLSGWNNRIDSL